MFIRRLVLLCVGVAIASHAGVAQQRPLPAPVGYVNDFANVIPEATRAQIESVVLRVSAATHGDIVVVTLPDLAGRAPSDVALELGRAWKVGGNAAIGDKARNAGVVILLVPKETSTDGAGHCRIEAGQGAEGFITDATSGSLCREAIPMLRERAYGDAISLLANRVAERFANEFNVSLDSVLPRDATRRSQQNDSIDPRVLLFIVVVVFIILQAMARSGRRRGCMGCIPIPIGGSSFGGRTGWGGGGFGGGGGGGGGGGFGGFGGGGGFSGGGGGADW